MICCFDTSSLIETWHRLYPPDIFPDLWEKLDELVLLGTVISPEEVLRELHRQDDDVLKWAKGRSAMFEKLEGSFLKKGIEITNRYKPLLDQKPGKNGADPWVIALAIDRRATVVTQEQPTGKMKSPRIPDVCRAEGVPCIDILAFIKTQKWTFRIG